MDLSDVQAVILESLVKPEDANAVLWHFARTPGVREPGSFTQALVDCIAKADPTNRHRLSYGFPGMVAAVQLAQGHDAGVAQLQRVAGIGSGSGDDPPTDEIDVAAVARAAQTAQERRERAQRRGQADQ